MIKLDDLKRRVNELLELGIKVLTTSTGDTYAKFVSNEGFGEFRTATLSFLKNAFGDKHPFYVEFDKNADSRNTVNMRKGVGILKAAKNEIDNGWIFTVRGLVSSEIFSDFLEMADYFLKEGYKDPAAVMIGGVLEEHLRQLCYRNGIESETIKDGKKLPKKAETMNSELASATVYNKLDQKAITSWLDLRNKAAHAHYTEYTKEQVEIMHSGVANFIVRMT